MPAKKKSRVVLKVSKLRAVDQYLPANRRAGASSDDQSAPVPGAQPQPSYRCDICNVDSSSDVDLRNHKRGRKHNENAINLLREDRFGVVIRIFKNDQAYGGSKDISEKLNQSDSIFKITYVLCNEGEMNVFVDGCKLMQLCSALTLENKPAALLRPGDRYKVDLHCSLKSEANVTTVVLFTYRVEETGNLARVTRKVKIHVVDNSKNDLRSGEPYKKPPRVSVDKAVTKILGGRPPRSNYNGPLEMEVPLKPFKVPMNVRQAVNKGLPQDSQEKKMLDEILTKKTHKKRFSFLLHAEEIQEEVDIRRYDLLNVSLTSCKEDKNLLKLDVPGLMENRPSVLRGDHLFVRPILADGTSDTTEYQGFVHDILQREVCLGFSQRLQKKWNENTNMKVNCRFTFNRLSIRLQHRAVELAHEKNGLESFLFPGSGDFAKGDHITYSSTRRFFDRDVEKNSKQKEAVDKILEGSSRPAPFIVFGPPGTGKTKTIVEAMNQVFRYINSSHILACAPSNSAADLIAQRILKDLPEDEKSKVYRMFAASREFRSIPEDLKNYSNLTRNGFEFPSKANLMKKRIIVCTLVTASRLVSANFPSKHFTHIFIDEAGQATEPEALIALAGIFDSDIVIENGGQVVLAGDPEQLGPVLRSPIAKQNGLDMSLLERYMRHIEVYKKEQARGYDNRLLVKLVQNYRSHPSILQIPNAEFYDNELQPHADRLERESMCAWVRDSLFNGKVKGKDGFPVVFHAVVGQDLREERSPSFFNVEEISLVAKHIKSLLESNSVSVKQSDIGVISPYRKQVQKIRTQLLKLKYDQIKVGTVEEFQGQERRVIIISTVRSSTEYLPVDNQFNLGFLKNPKRFNVAVTRAKALLIIVGNPQVLVEDLLWSKMLRLCIANGTYLGGEPIDGVAGNDSVEQLLQEIDDLLEELKDMHLNDDPPPTEN